MSISVKLCNLMEETHTSTYKLAKAIDVHQTTVTNWRESVFVPKLDKLQKIADYFDVPINYFLEQEKTAP